MDERERCCYCFCCSWIFVTCSQNRCIYLYVCKSNALDCWCCAPFIRFTRCHFNWHVARRRIARATMWILSECWFIGRCFHTHNSLQTNFIRIKHTQTHTFPPIYIYTLWRWNIFTSIIEMKSIWLSRIIIAFIKCLHLRWFKITWKRFWKSAHFWGLWIIIIRSNLR